MEKDAEVKGEGNSYTTQFRQYDPRLGRWLSLDPLMNKFPSMSPFTAFNNNPNVYKDPLGLASEVVNESLGGGDGNGKIVKSAGKSASRASSKSSVSAANGGAIGSKHNKEDYLNLKARSETIEISEEIKREHAQLESEGVILYDNPDEAAMAFANEYGPNVADDGNDPRARYEHVANIFYVGGGKYAVGNVHTDNERSSVDPSKSRLKDYTDVRATIHSHPGNHPEKYTHSEPARDWHKPDRPGKPEDILNARQSLFNGKPGDKGIALEYNIAVYIVNANNEVRLYTPPEVGEISISYSNLYEEYMSHHSLNYDCETEKYIGSYGKYE